MAEKCKACGGYGYPDSKIDGHVYCVCHGTGVEPVATIPINGGDFPPFSIEYGCGDNSCWLRTVRGGAGTNGGCRCLEFIPQEFYDKKCIISRALQLSARDRSRLAAVVEARCREEEMMVRYAEAVDLLRHYDDYNGRPVRTAEDVELELESWR